MAEKDPSDLQLYLPPEMRKSHCVVSRATLNRIYFMGLLLGTGIPLMSFGFLMLSPFVGGFGVILMAVGIWIRVGLKRYHRTYADLPVPTEPTA